MRKNISIIIATIIFVGAFTTFFAAPFAVIKNNYSITAKNGVYTQTGEDNSQARRAELEYIFDDLFETYTVAGLSGNWMADNPGDTDNPLKIELVIPAEYDGAEGNYPVGTIGKNAFRCELRIDGEVILKSPEYITQYSIIAVDFSSAVNLELIDDYAFMGTDIEAVDLSACENLFKIGNYGFYACNNLKRINLIGSSVTLIGKLAFSACIALEVVDLRCLDLFYIQSSAFSNCDKLQTVYFGAPSELLIGIPMAFEDILDKAHIKNIVLCDKDMYETALEFAADEVFMPGLTEFFTYETEITFDSTDGDGGTVKQTKLCNRPLDYEKREDGAWARNPDYKTPSAGNYAGYVYKWAEDATEFSADAGNIVVGDGASYRAVWSYALKARLELPPGFILYTNKKPEILAPYIVAEYFTDGYTSSQVSGCTVWYADGQAAFKEGENSVIIAYNGLSVSVLVNAELPPPSVTPAWVYWLIGAGAVIICAALIFLAYYIKAAKRRKATAEGEINSLQNEKEDLKQMLLQAEQNGKSFALPQELTETEKTVAEALFCGLSRKEIAAKLFITNSTVNFHLSNIFRKCGCQSVNEFLIKYKK